PCPHCGQPQQLHLLQEHVQSLCPDVEVDCPNTCFQKVLRHKLVEHQESCPEVHVSCSYSRFGCSVQGKRGTVDIHEDAAVNHHMLLVLRSNDHLEQQVEVLQQEVLLRQQEVQADNLLLAGLQKKIRPLLQQTDIQECDVSASQRTQRRQDDVLSTVLLDVQQVSRGLPGLEELEQLRRSLDTVTQEVSTAEALKEHLGRVEDNVKDHSCLLDLHEAQLSCNKQRLQELEATSYDGKLIWKIQDFRRKRDAEVRGQTPCLSSVSFHAGRCGYKMAVKAYLNGDGEGRGTHLSLYVVLMPGDFDALLPWPFRQTVSLSLLDQRGAADHRSLSFRPDPASKSFQQPDTRAASNLAVGFSCFCPLDELQDTRDAAYVRDDTLFVRVKVDMSGLDL
ncbi:TNF receptor-associated factor 5-like, partial [Solea senegalensis]